MRTLILQRGPDVRRAILLGLSGGVPVFFLRGLLDPFGIPKLSLLAFGLAIVIAVRAAELFQGSSAQGLVRLLLPAAGFALPLALSWALSPYRGWGLLGVHGRLGGLVPYLLAVLLGVLVADAFAGRVGQLALAFAWAGAIVGGYAAMQTVGLDPFEWSLYGAPTEAVSTTGNPNFTGGFLGIAMPVALTLVLYDSGRRRIAVRLLALITLGWLLARSQGGWAAGVAGTAIVLGHWGRQRHRLLPMAGLTVAALVAIGVVGFVVLAMVRPESRFATSASIVRALWWQAAAVMGLDHPIAGRGPNSFGIEGVHYRTLDDALGFNYDFPTDPHSVPLSMFANLGVLGLLGFLGIFAWLLMLYLRSGNAPPLQVAFFAAAIAYLIQSIVSIDEISLRVGLWASLGGFAASVGPDESAVRRQSKRKSVTKKRPNKTRSARDPLRHPAPVAAFAAVALAAVAWAGSLVVADAKVRQGGRQIASGEIDAGHATYRSALSLNDWADYRGRLGFALAAAAGDGDDIDQGLASSAAEALSFTDEVPYVFSIVGRARILEDAAKDRGVQDPEVVALYNRAMEIDPLNPLIRVELARVLLRQDETDAVLTVLLDLKGDVGARYPEYWGVLALSAAEAGDDDLAREAIEMAESLSPGQVDAVRAEEIVDGQK